MKKIFIAILLLGIVVIAGCKKDSNNEQVNGILAGHWSLTKIHNIYIDSNQHVIQDTVLDVNKYNLYIQFNNNNTGTTTVPESVTASGGFSDVAVEGKFNYKISSQNLTIDYQNGGSLTTSFIIDDNNELLINHKGSLGGFISPQFKNSTLDQTEYYSK